MDTLCFLAGAFLGAFLGFCLSAILGAGARADLMAQCAECEASYQAKLMRHAIKLDANDQEWWENEYPQASGAVR